MEDLTILHLSDLHYDLSKQKDIEIVIKALFSDLEKIRETGIKPGLIIFSGDLIHAGDYGYADNRNDYDKPKKTRMCSNFESPRLYRTSPQKVVLMVLIVIYKKYSSKKIRSIPHIIFK